MSISLLTTIFTILFSVIGIVISVLVYQNSKKQYENAQEQYVLNQKVFSHAHILSKRQCALDLVGNWDRDTLQSRICITNKWKDRFQNRVPRITHKEIIAYRDSQVKKSMSENKSLDELKPVTVHIQIILNYFENFALAIENDIANEQVLKDAFKMTFERWYLALQDYKKEITLERMFDPWAPLDRLYKRWFPEEYPLEKDNNKQLTGI
jgi:hypothetical protein